MHTKNLSASVVCAVGFMTLLSTDAAAQIFKKNTADSATVSENSKVPDEPKKKPKPQKNVTPKVKAKAPPAKKMVSQPTANAAKNTAAEKTAQDKPDAQAKPADADALEASPVGDDCASLQDCVASIQKILDNMKTEEELTRLNRLVHKAEMLLAAEAGAASEALVTTSEESDVSGALKPITVASASTDEPEPKPTSPEATAVGSGTMTAEEENALIERVSKLEEALASVMTKAEENEKKLAEKESKGGFKIFGPKDSVFTIAGLLQTRMETIQKGAPNGEDWSYGLYIRRMRLMFYGQITKWLNFFIETEQAKFGLNGDWSGRMFIQDAYVELNLHPAIQIDVGMMLPALSHHANQSAASLLGIDYHAALVKYPTGSTMVWRDMGVMVRGLVFNDKLDYRLAIWSGVHGSASDFRNPKDAPRLTGRLTANVFEAEGGGGVGGMFFDGLYLKKDGNQVVSTKRVLSFGVSFDWQPDLNVELAARDPNTDPSTPDTPTDWSDYAAVAGDIFWDLPFGENKIMSANGQIDFYYYNHGDRRSDEGYWYYNAAGNSLNYTGWGMFGEFGVRYSKIQPLFSMDIYDSTQADGKTGDYLNFSGGLNYYLLAHAATFKLEAGAEKVADGDWTAAVKFQLQFVF